jgi:hypothetical protein
MGEVRGREKRVRWQWKEWSRRRLCAAMECWDSRKHLRRLYANPCFSLNDKTGQYLVIEMASYI